MLPSRRIWLLHFAHFDGLRFIVETGPDSGAATHRPDSAYYWLLSHIADTVFLQLHENGVGDLLGIKILARLVLNQAISSRRFSDRPG